MADIITALTQKRSHIIAKQRELDVKYNADKSHFAHELELVNEAIRVINNAAEQFLCPKCHGTGTVRVCDAAGDMDDDVCPACKGLGVKLED